MTTPDYRALCAGLIESVRYLLECWRDPENGVDPVCLAEVEAQMHEARALLAAQPEPEGAIEEFVSQCRPLDDETLALLTPEVRWRLYDEASGDQPEPPSRLHHCPTHGQQPENAWGCPECVREMRQQLAQPKPEGPTDDSAPSGYAYRYPSIDGSVIRFNDGQEVNGCRPLHAIPYWLGQPPARPAIKPVPVSERPWEREGWCDAEGKCWMGDGGGSGFVPSWRLCKPSDSYLAWSLPHHALPVPEVTP